MKKTLATLLALAVTLTACSGDGGGDDQRDEPTTESVRELEKAWDADWMPTDASTTTAFAAGDQVVVAADRRIVGADPETGEADWTINLPSICEVSQPSSNRDLFAVVWRGKGPNAGCRNVGVIDPRQGRWSWRSKLPKPTGQYAAGSPLTVGDSSVTVITECCYAQALRLDLRSGRTLRSIVPAADGLTGWASSDGQTIATATKLDYTSHKTLLRVYDADKGKLLWTRAVRELVEKNVAAQVVSSDPLVLQTSDRGHPMMRTFDRATGKPLTPVGPQFTDSGVPDITSLGVHDDTLVLAHGNALNLALGAIPLRAYDLESGDERWSNFPAAGGFSGFDDSGRIVVVTESGTADEPSTVTRHSTGDIDEFDVLGTVPGNNAGSRFVVEDLVLVASLDEGTDFPLAAYRLPEEGQDVDFEVPDEGPAEADAQPEDFDCQPSKQTLTDLGFHRLEVAEQFGCRWFERQEPFGVTRDLTVSHEVATPRNGTSAARVAQQSIRAATKRAPFNSGPVPSSSFRRVAGIGDEAYVSSIVGPGTYAQTHLAVRVGNVVVRVEVKGEVQPEPVRGATVPAHVLEDGALAVVEDLFDQAGITLQIPTDRARDRGHAKARPICGPMDSAVRATVPDGQRLDQHSPSDREGRTAGCHWGRGSDDIHLIDGEPKYADYAKITAYAVPGSRLLQRTGLQQARSGMNPLRKGAGAPFYESGEPVPDLGDEALLFPAKEEYDASKVVVRTANVLLQVELNDQASEDHAGQDAAAIALAREAAAAYS